MAEPLSPEQRARSIIPPNYRAETAQTGVIPSMDMVLSSRCAGGLRDAIASAIRAAETAAVDRCVETLRDMGMHETALMLHVTLEADNAR